VGDFERAVVIWLAWRQFRTSAYIALGILAVIGVALAITGPNLAHVYDTVVKTCAVHNDCPSVTNNFTNKYHLLQDLRIVIILVPVVLGMFWGAPLVAREMETHTNRVAWTQSVTRRRWFFTRVGIVCLATALTAGLYTLMVTWWMSPFNALQANAFSEFDHGGITPIGYSLFAVALGICAGAMIRRTLPAIGVTLVGFLAVRLAITHWVRPRLDTPLHTTSAFTVFGPNFKGGPASGSQLSQGDWVTSDAIVNAHGRVIGQNGGIGPNGAITFRSLGGGRTEFVGVGTCPNAFPNGPPRGFPSHVSVSVGDKGGPGGALQRATTECVNHFHLTQVLGYQPANRYWPFQWSELGIYVALAIALVALTAWWVRRRLT
jgi:hypothetical protein